MFWEVSYFFFLGEKRGKILKIQVNQVEVEVFYALNYYVVFPIVIFQYACGQISSQAITFSLKFFGEQHFLKFDSLKYYQVIFLAAVLRVQILH